MEKKIKVKIPSLPNFLQLESETPSVLPLKDFTEEQLRELAQEWTEALVKKSKQKVVDQ